LGAPLAGPPPVSPLNKGVFGICTGSSESREKYFQKKGVKGGIPLKVEKKSRIF